MTGTPTTTDPTGRCARCGQHADNLKPLTSNGTTAPTCWTCRIEHSAARRKLHQSGHARDPIERKLRRIRRGKRR